MELVTPTAQLKTLLESDTTLVTYAATPYSLCDELMRVKKDYPGISVELHTVKDGEWNVCSPDRFSNTIYAHILVTNRNQ